jgi:hypothetical protein
MIIIIIVTVIRALSLMVYGHVCSVLQLLILTVRYQSCEFNARDGHEPGRLLDMCQSGRHYLFVGLVAPDSSLVVCN